MKIRLVGTVRVSVRFSQLFLAMCTLKSLIKHPPKMHRTLCGKYLISRAFFSSRRKVVSKSYAVIPNLCAVFAIFTLTPSAVHFVRSGSFLTDLE